MKTKASPERKQSWPGALGWVLALVTAASPAFSDEVPISANVPAAVVVPSKFKSDSLASWQGRAEDSNLHRESAWWGIFGDSALDRLEDQALVSNQDLQGAISRVMEARAQAGAVASGLYPKVTAPLEATRLRTTNTSPVTTSRIIGNSVFAVPPGTTFGGQALSNTFNDLQTPVVVGYEVDVFGRVKHAVDQARANAEASLADRQGNQAEPDRAGGSGLFLASLGGLGGRCAKAHGQPTSRGAAAAGAAGERRRRKRHRFPEGAGRERQYGR